MGSHVFVLAWLGLRVFSGFFGQSLGMVSDYGKSNGKENRERNRKGDNGDL